jgi:hypothetical protein
MTPIDIVAAISETSRSMSMGSNYQAAAR